MKAISFVNRHFRRIAAAVFLYCIIAGSAAAQDTGIAGGQDRGLTVAAPIRNRYALVIGNAEYKNISPLQNTKNDAEDIAASLTELGFQVELKYDLTHLQTVAVIDAFTTQLAGDRANEGFFWYAGHAVQVRDENYLLPIDVTVDSENLVAASSFRLNNLIESLGNARNKINVVILDSCRDNPLPPSGRSAGMTRGMSVVQNVPSDLFVMYSTAPGEKASDGAEGKRNSPFAEAFLTYIKSNEAVVMMAADVVNKTLELTGNKQRPFTSGSIVSEKYYSLNPGGQLLPPPLPPDPNSYTPSPAPEPRPEPPVYTPPLKPMGVGQKLGYGAANIALGLGSYLNGDIAGGITLSAGYAAAAGLFLVEAFALDWDSPMVGVPATIGVSLAGATLVYGFIRPFIYNRSPRTAAFMDNTQIDIVQKSDASGQKGKTGLRLSYTVRF
jgi:hypothetical protein